MSHPTNTNNITSPSIISNPINPGVMASPAVWKRLQSLLATYPGPPPSATSTLDRSPNLPAKTWDSQTAIDFKKPATATANLIPTARATCSVNQDPIETSNSASNLPMLITDPQNYNFTTGAKKRESTNKPVDGKSGKDRPVNPWKQFMGPWKWVTYAKSPELYTERFQNLKGFLSTQPAVLAYLEMNIIPVEELFVVAWAYRQPHLWNLNTSRALGPAVNAQILAVHKSIGKDTMKALVHLPKCFIPVLGKISLFAIKKTIGQFDQLKTYFDPTEPCSQTLITGVGIPCAHRLAEILESGSPITPKDFHDQWNLKYNPEFTREEVAEVDLDHKIRKLTIALSHKLPTRLGNLFDNFHQMVAGTHVLAEADFKKEESSKKRNIKALLPPKPKQAKKYEEESNPPDSDVNNKPSDGEGSKDYDLKDIPLSINCKNEDTNQKENENIDKEENTKEDEDNTKQEIVSENKEDLINKTFSNGDKDEYIRQIPDHLHKYIKYVFIPIEDGNCGFHCVAKSVGYEDDGWFRV
ncbi:hypothetical protein PSHT_02124 [Puccinia striiformis]|uniref:OTU domain-containing protein n=1 Tax=Puccinia striiformis TaxID=27350 RepID=A0A2S4WIK8_9BASI|nr:hypothetical protein PSHT_02124 [Puccinia striiformis]